MKYISHRGNIGGRYENLENLPYYIDEALNQNYDVEIDIRLINNNLFLGHDHPDYKIEFEWLLNRISKLWIHCKNIEALVYFKQCGYLFNYFWHQEDDVTLTSHGYLWTYPGKSITPYSVAVMPETKHFEKIYTSYGICSDYISNYKI